MHSKKYLYLYFILPQALETEIQRLTQIARQLPCILPKDDHRLLHPVIYLIACQAPNEIVLKFMLEQFSLCRKLIDNEK